MTRNRDPRRQYACVFVEQLLTAIAEGDRWAVARRTTGGLLEQLLAAESSGGGPHPLPRLRHVEPGLREHPLAVVDDDVAVVIGNAGTEAEAIPVLAILVASDTAPHPWLAAGLDTTAEIDRESRIATVLGEHTEAADVQIIARHSPLDPTVAEVDWNNPATVLRTHAYGVVTVADAAAEIPADRSVWPYVADTCATLTGWYLRANYPELVREHRWPLGE